MDLNRSEPTLDNDAMRAADSSRLQCADKTQNELIQEPASKAKDASENIKTTKVLLIVSVLLSMFLVSLDRTIISTVRVSLRCG